MKKRAQLVCQHLENVSRKALEDYHEIIRNYALQRYGVYALYGKGKLQYVGLAKNLRNRLARHLTDKHKESWDQFSIYFTIGDHHLQELEALILRIMKPKGNLQKGAFSRSEDIRPRFRRDIKKFVLKGVEDLFPIKRKTPDEGESGFDEEPKPILAKYRFYSRKLRANLKGKEIWARIRQDGSIRFAGKTYNSPSAAGTAVFRGRACNGWTFWKYERAPGDWILLDTLRK